MTKHYFLVDVETTGTSYTDAAVNETALLLEFSYILLDETFNEVHRGSYITGYLHELNIFANGYVREMHRNSGLEEALNNRVQYHNALSNVSYAEKEVLNKLNELKIEKLVPMGNNVQFDVEFVRRYMPKLFSLFNYSFLDVSAMRKCLGTLNEDIPNLIYKHKGNNHRSMKDCEECLKEFKVIQTLISIGVENIYSNEYLETIIELGFKDE